MDGWMDGWVDAWVDGSVDGWMDGWMNEDLHEIGFIPAQKRDYTKQIIRTETGNGHGETFRNAAIELFKYFGSLLVGDQAISCIFNWSRVQFAGCSLNVGIWLDAGRIFPGVNVLPRDISASGGVVVSGTATPLAPVVG